MGPLTLPTHGPVYLDANGFIYSVERVEPYRTLLEPMWQQARAGEFDVASSDITVLETLVKPLREGERLSVRTTRGTPPSSHNAPCSPFTSAANVSPRHNWA